MTPPAIPPHDDEGAARRLGITLEQYRSLQRTFHCENVEAVVLAARRKGSETASAENDLESEEATYRGLRQERGLFRSPGEAPGWLKTASRTPGQIAQMILTCILWLLLLVLSAPYYQAWGFREALSIIPFFGSALIAYVAAGWIWRSLGVNLRDKIRVAIRCWPVTLVVLVFALGLLRMALGR